MLLVYCTYIAPKVVLALVQGLLHKGTGDVFCLGHSRFNSISTSIAMCLLFYHILQQNFKVRLYTWRQRWLGIRRGLLTRPFPSPTVSSPFIICYDCH